MIRARPVGLAGMVVAGMIGACPAGADALQDQVLAGMRATRTQDLSFTLAIRAEQTGSTPHQSVLRYDPRGANGGWTIQSINGAPPTAKQRQQAARQRPPVPDYGKLATWFGHTATRTATAPGSVAYHFAALPAGTIKLGSHDASADTVADVVVDTTRAQPYVSRVRFVSTKAFRMMLVARVERFVVTSGYAPIEDGRIFSTGNDSEFAGSLLGKAGAITTRMRVSDVRPAR